jgi:hypothetical protein
MRMMPELDDWTLELHGHHLVGARLIQDGSSLLGFVFVIVMLIYALRGGDRPATAGRALDPTQRHRWALCYGIATLVFTAGFYALDHEGGAYWAAASAHNNAGAIALLRGLASAAICVSLGLGRYLRAGCGKLKTSDV